MCKYCEKYSAKAEERELGDIFIVEPAMYTYVGDGFLYVVPMNYCPNCGRKLRKENIHGKT